MKFLTVFAVLCLVAYSTQSPLYEDCDEKVQTYFDEKSCMHVECYSFDNKTVHVAKMSANSCPLVELTCEEGKQYKDKTPGDEAAVYPGCCDTAICE